MEQRITRENFHSVWESILIKATDRYDTPPEVIHVSNSTISTLGNFSASTGKGKSKKTFNVCAIVASALTGNKVLNYEAHFPDEKRKVLYFDTEQSSYHCHKVLERINKLAGLPTEQDSDLIEFVMLREYNPLERCQIIDMALAERPDVGLVIIDGLRDLLFDINSSTEAAEVIGLLMRWTSQYNLHIHTVLHLNKADDNVRGHIGTELNHKAETILQISRNDNDSNVSEVHATLIRDKDFPPFAFRINKDSLPEIANDVILNSQSKQSVFDYHAMPEELHRQALDVTFHKISGPIDSYETMLDLLKIGYGSIGFDRSRGIRVKLLKFLVTNEIIKKEETGYVYNREFHYVPIDRK